VSTFADTELAEAASEISDTVSAEWWPLGVEANKVTLVNVVWNPGRVAEMRFEDAQHQDRRGILTVTDGLVTSPDTRDAYKLDGVVYACEEVLETVPFVDVQLAARDELEVVRQGHRIRR